MNRSTHRHMTSKRSTIEREELTRGVLLMPLEMSHALIAERFGIQRETARKIRYGQINADVASDLPRVEKGQLTRSCQQCIHWDTRLHRDRPSGDRLGACSLDLPEGGERGFARLCAAFALGRCAGL